MDVNQIFRDIGMLVHEQGDVIGKTHVSFVLYTDVANSLVRLPRGFAICDSWDYFSAWKPVWSNTAQGLFVSISNDGFHS